MPFTIPETMAALELSGTGIENARLVRRPVPRPGPGQLLCRVDAFSICASDAKLVRQGSRHSNLHGWDLSRRPVTPGHEGSLTVVEVGERLHGEWRPGERLVVAPNIAGPPRFDAGDYGKRSEDISRITIGFTLPGFFAEFVLLRDDVLAFRDHAIRCPDGVPYHAASLAEPFSTVLAAHASMVHVTRSGIDGERLLRAGVLPGGVALVIGAGPMGILHAANALTRRPRAVVVSEPDAARRQNAQRLRPIAEKERSRLLVVSPEELPVTLGGESRGKGADDVIVTAGFSRVEEEAVTLAAPGGCVSLFASNAPDDTAMRIDTRDVHYRAVALSGTSGSDPADLRKALELADRGALDFGLFVAAVAGGMGAARDALASVIDAKHGGKVVVYPHAPASALRAVDGWSREAEQAMLGARETGGVARSTTATR